MVETQKDPMEPPKFKTNKKIPRGPPSPPAPVMHSPNRKVRANVCRVVAYKTGLIYTALSECFGVQLKIVIAFSHSCVVDCALKLNKLWMGFFLCLANFGSRNS